MITSFFKPKSAKKVTPAESAGDQSKRGLEGGTKYFESNKRQKLAIVANDAVEELLSTLEDPPRGGDEATWKDVLEKHSKTPSFSRLANFVASER